MMPWLPAALIVGLEAAVPMMIDSRSPGPRQDPAVVVDAKQVIALISEGKYNEVTTRWAPKLKDALPAPKVEQFWKELVASVGPLETVGSGQIMNQGEFVTVVLTLTFARGSMVGSVTYDAEGRVAGLYFNPKQ